MNSGGTYWKDPPEYFEKLVYPAYVDAHRSMFTVRLSIPLEVHELTENATGRRCRTWLVVTPRHCGYRGLTAEHG